MHGSLFHNKKRTPLLKEEKLVIYVIRRKVRHSVEEDLRKELGEQFTPKDVENVLDLLIQDLRENGALKRILDRYLKLKIADEKARFGAPSK